MRSKIPVESNISTVRGLRLGFAKNAQPNLRATLRDTIGAITEGRVAGSAIIHVKVSREGAIVTIDAILDNQ